MDGLVIKRIGEIILVLRGELKIPFKNINTVYINRSMQTKYNLFAQILIGTN